MITIAQKKIAGFEPRWASFRGFSVLFDNPVGCTEELNGLHKIACPQASGGLSDFYWNLKLALDKLDRDLLFRTYLFCPLPSASYHATVWDGINADNVSSVLDPIRSEWCTFLRGLPDSLIATPKIATPKSMSIVTKSSLLTRPSRAISLCFDKLTIWGNQVLVARLKAVKRGASKANLDFLRRRRSDLCEKAEAALGVGFRTEYSPHISLGYFANQEHGQLASSQVDRWTALFRDELRGSDIKYDSLGVYGFTDMATFYRR